MSEPAVADDDVLAVDPADRQQLRLLARSLSELRARHEGARLIGPDGAEIVLPASAFRALQRVVEAMSQGASIALVPNGKELTTKQAADLLHVSRPFLVRQLLGKEIPFERVGSHRRVRLEDVLAYRERRARARQKLLDD